MRRLGKESRKENLKEEKANKQIEEESRCKRSGREGNRKCRVRVGDDEGEQEIEGKEVRK